MVEIKLYNIDKSFRRTPVLKNVSFTIYDKEYFIILGPTGAGKTTLLKIIAGLEFPDSGNVYFDGINVTKKTPGERNLGFMFENYALFPNMNLVENVAYSSRVHNRNKEMTRTLVEQVLMMTLLTGRDDAVPEELSGGMKQRVALCRALMNLEQTKLLILDEPLKALDAGLRMNLREELLSMAKSKELELTVVHVTNEEQEAMMVADRIAVMDQGEIIQIGTPHEIYYHPKNLFVANFLSEINYFEGNCIKKDRPKWDIYQRSEQTDKIHLEIHEDSSPMLIDLGNNQQYAAYVRNDLLSQIEHGENILLVVRANHMKIRLGNRIDQKMNGFIGKITRRKFMGVFYRFEVIIYLKGNEKKVVVTIPATAEIHRRFVEDSEVTVYFPKELGIVFKHPGSKTIQETLKLE